MKIVSNILNRYVESLRVVKTDAVFLGAKQAEKFYFEHRGKSFFDELIKAMTGQCFLLVLEGEDAIEKVRAINGQKLYRRPKKGIE